MPKPRYTIEKVRSWGKNRPVAWFDDIFYAYQFIEAVVTDRLNPDFEYVIIDTAEHV